MASAPISVVNAVKALTVFVSAFAISFSARALPAPAPIIKPTSMSVRGYVSIQASQVFLLPVADGVPLSEKPLPIQTTLGIRMSLLDLKTGDFVVVAGALEDVDGDGKPDKLNVHAIESVGLHELLGTWRSAKWDIIRFEDFNRVSVYRPNFHYGTYLVAEPNGAELSKFLKLKDMNYTLAPELGSSYSIFLVEKAVKGLPAPVYVGRLRLAKNVVPPVMTLEIFDPKTGSSSEVLSLSPVRE